MLRPPRQSWDTKAQSFAVEVLNPVHAETFLVWTGFFDRGRKAAGVSPMEDIDPDGPVARPVPDVLLDRTDCVSTVA